MMKALKDERETPGTVAEAGIANPAGLERASGGLAGQGQRLLGPIASAEGARRSEQSRRDACIAVAPGQTRGLGVASRSSGSWEASVLAARPATIQQPCH